MALELSLPALLSFAASIFLFALMPHVWSYRDDNPAAAVYTALLAAVAFWAFVYGAALTVHDPELRRLMEVPVWLARISTVYLILVTGFRYSGFHRRVPAALKAGVAGLFAAAWLLQVGNVLGWHSFLWTSFEVTVVYGAAAVELEPTVWLYILIAAAYLCVAFTYLLALEAVLSYGPLYRKHAVAIVVWSLPPLTASLLWTSSLGSTAPLDHPVLALDLTAPSLLVTASVLAYILFESDESLIEIVPANRRMAERVAADDVDTGVVMVNRGGAVLGLNQAAEEVFGVTESEALTKPFCDVSGVDMELPLKEARTVVFPSDPGRTYQLCSTEVEGDGDNGPMGYTVTLEDVTKQRQRQQRLEVLNRVLRHNLRNDMVVVNGGADEISATVDDIGVSDDLGDRLKDRAEMIQGKAEELLEVSEKARDVYEALPTDVPRRDDLNVVRLVESVVGDVEREHPEADVQVSTPGERRIQSDERLMSLVLENAVENAAEHGGGDVTVSVSLDEAKGFDDGVRVEVEDDGPGLPEQELQVVEDGGEGSLDHGSGLGLWMIEWGVRELGGTVDYEVDDGTKAVVEIPCNSDEDL